jgi:AcrR family transcriptional regulator
MTPSPRPEVRTASELVTRGKAAPTVRRTQAQRSADMRRRVLDAAVQMLADKGYAGFRTADVADAAGVSKGALTHHFATKDALVLDTLEHVFRIASDKARQRAHGKRSVDAAIGALLDDSRDFFFSDLFLIAIDLAIQSGHDSPNGAQIQKMSRDHRAPVEQAWLAALVDAGVPAALAEDLLWLTISIVRGLAVRRLLADDPARFERVLKLWRTMVADFLRDTTDR